MLEKGEMYFPRKDYSVRKWVFRNESVGDVGVDSYALRPELTRFGGRLGVVYDACHCLFCVYLHRGSMLAVKTGFYGAEVPIKTHVLYEYKLV